MSLSKQLVTSMLGLALLAPGAAGAEEFGDPSRQYKVIVNHEEQYSIWPADREPPRGWKEEGRTGGLRELQRYVSGVWTDMRPLSIRREAKRSGRDDAEYRVVVNHEEQYSIWFADRDFASGWKDTGTRGPLARCQRYIDEVWTDMRPLSVR